MLVHLNSYLNVRVPGNVKSAKNTSHELDKMPDTAKQEEKVSLSSRCKFICPECSNYYPNTTALQLHIWDQHKWKVQAIVSPGPHHKGTSVDFDKGIFMMSCTFSGTMHPLNCQHKTNAPYNSKPVSTSWEIDECMEAA